MNAKGHKIQSIYMSGGQAKNLRLMQLFANTCSMPVILPHNHSTSVVLGAAMLGRFAAEAVESGAVVKERKQADRLWKIMVEMTPVGTLVAPAALPREKNLLEAKYKIFRESAEIQKRWRKEMEDALKV